MRSIPNTVIAAPKDETEFKRMLWKGLEITEGPYIIRYPRGCGEGAAWKEAAFEAIPAGRGSRIREGSGAAILVLGPFKAAALEAADRCRELYGISPAVYDMRFVKPLDTDILDQVAATCSKIVTVEDGTLKGGLFGAVAEYYAPKGLSIDLEGIGIPDRFITHAPQRRQRAACGIDADGILERLQAMMKK